MEHQTKTYFKEHEYDDVKGFTVINTKGGKYHIAEKWLKEDGDDRWIDYWIPETQLIERMEQETDEGNPFCEPKGQLTEEQFGKVCELVGWYTEDESEAEEVAA